MEAGWLAAVSGFAIAMAATPGPNNTLVTASGANYGLRRSLPLMAGIAFGVAAIILIAGVAGAALLADPWVGLVIKWTGVVYLLWLTWRIGTARPAVKAPRRPGGPEREEDAGGTPLGFLQGALLQLVNPKLWAMVAGAVATYGSTAENAAPSSIALAFALIFGTATFASTLLWTLIGIGAARFIATDRGMRRFNRAMAALLLLSLAPVLVG